MSVPPACYRLYGLTIESSLALPCQPAAGPAEPDVRLVAGRAARFDAARRHLSGPPSWFRSTVLPDGTMYLAWTGLFEFLIAPGAAEIAYRRLAGAARESFHLYLLGHVLSFVLAARGIEALHSTVVLVGGEAVAFLGDCGYGKSTLGAAFLARGFPILTDDLAALDRRGGRWAVHRGIPRVKLFPSTARRVLGFPVRGRPMIRGTAKLVLPVDAAGPGDGLMPLGAIYVLADPAAQRRTRRVRIRPATGGSALLEIVRAAFNLSVVDPRRLSTQFRTAAHLVADVPIRRLAYPRAVNRLPAVCAAVLADLGRVGRGRARRVPPEPRSIVRE